MKGWCLNRLTTGPNQIISRVLLTDALAPCFGSGSRIRTYDLRVMSPTRCQLLHPAILVKEDVGFEPTHAFTRLTVFKTVPFSRTWVILQNSPYGIRTRVTAVKRRCLNPLTNGPNFMGTSGLEPPTSRLSGVRSNHLSYAPKLKTW